MFWQRKPIVEKAKQLAPAVVELARRGAPIVLEALYSFGEVKPAPERESEHTISLAADLRGLAFYLLDRECFARHGADERNRFMDVLMVETWRPFLDTLPETEREITWRAIIERANRTQLEYAQFPQLYPGKDQPYGGTLIWEFSKKLHRVYNPPGDVGVVFLMMPVVIQYVTSLYRLIEEVKL
jgi:hypothetical protein